MSRRSETFGSLKSGKLEHCDNRDDLIPHKPQEVFVKNRKKIFDYEWEEVLDTRTRELIRVACAVAVGCPD